MRKFRFFLALAALILMLSSAASAANFELDDKAVFYGMEGRSWYQGYEPTVQWGNFSICLPLRSERASGPVTASIALDDPDLLLFRSQPGTVRVSPREEIYPVSLTVPLAQNRRNGDYPAKITISGKSQSGEPVTETFPYVIRVRDGSDNPETLTPKIDLSGDLNVGEDCILNVSIHNPATTLSMTEGTLTLTEESGDILVSGSDRLELPEILPGQTLQIQVPVTVKGKAAVEPHSLGLKLSYQVLDEVVTWEQTFTHPVNQQIRLEQGGVSMPSSALQGELTNLSVPLMNMGKGKLCNAMVTLEFPELIQRQSVLVGTIEPGATGQAKLTFTPPGDALGEYSGTVTISCEDEYGNMEQMELPVSITIQEAKPVSTAQAEEEKPAAPGWLLPLAAAMCLGLLVGLIVQGVLLRSKLHKLEEERL